MLRDMRTMMILDDDLLRQAKSLASRLGIPLTRLVADSLRLRLNQTAAARKTKLKPLPVCKAKGFLRPGLSLDDIKTIYAAMDDGLPIDKQR